MKHSGYTRLILTIFLLLCMRAEAKPIQGDTLQVHFRVGQSDLDMNFADNKSHVDEFVKNALRSYGSRAPKDLHLQIFTGASPEGPSELNRRLGEQRGMALRKVLIDRLEGLVENITVVNQGARWGQLYNMVEQSQEPWREDVLTILGKRPETDEWKTDDREQRLRKLKNGLVWRELNTRYLPVLRSSGSAIIAPIEEEVKAELSRVDTIVILDTIIYLPEPCPQYEPPIDLNPAWALKTNLLLWGVIAPNIQLERSLGKTNRWSMEAEFFMPWWTWSKNAHAEQFVNGGLELRYWLGNRQKHHTLDGWHLGLAVAGGYYDFGWKNSEGWQGEYLNVYCNLGFQHRFGRRNQWAVDGGIGLGWIPTKYRHYLGSSVYPEGFEERYDDHLMWQNNGWKHYLGATHVNFTLAYIFTKKSKKHQTVSSEPMVTMPITTNYTEPTPKAVAKAEKKAAKEAAKEAEKQGKIDAKAAKEAAKEAEKQGKIDAKAAKEAAKEAEKQGKIDAKAAKEAAKEAEKQAKIDAKAAEEAAKEAEKEALKQGKVDAKAAKEAAKEAEKQAKIDAKAAEEAAKEAEKEALRQSKANEKAAKEAHKAASKAAKEEAKQSKKANQ